MLKCAIFFKFIGLIKLLALPQYNCIQKKKDNTGFLYFCIGVIITYLIRKDLCLTLVYHEKKVMLKNLYS